jgi:tetratricopeptide (TPR) repeat protein
MGDPGTTAVVATVLGRRGDAHWARARASLAQGRHADALEAVRRARRLRPAEDAPLLALVEGDALVGLQRYGEAVGVATRALRRRPLEPDLAARLRVLRGHGLWLAGRIRSGGAEVRRAADEARQPLTRGRVHETLALFAWKEQALDLAAEHVRSAHEAYAGAATPAALARVLAREAGVLRDLGRLDEALVVQDRRLQAASRSGRADALAEARVDRAGLLTALGRWDEADDDVEIAVELFARVGHGPESAGATAVVVDLARGDLPRARARLAAGRERMAERGNVRGLAEALLLSSDLHLAARQTEEAERTATEALDLYRVVRDGEGQCRSRVRRAHALVEMGRCADAAGEARRALACAAASRSDLVALVHLALGRACMRVDRAAARDAFARAQAASGARAPFAAAAALGLALLDGASRDDARVTDAVSALERWGDRRVLAVCLADLAELAPRAPARVTAGAGSGRPPAAAGSRRALVDAAAALLAEGSWPDRWAAAMRAVQRDLPWWRAALVADPGLELRGDLDRAVPLAPRDLARDLAAAGCEGVVRLDAGEWAAHPTRVLHGLAAAILCRAWDGAFLYVDVRGDAGAGDVALAADLARLLASRPPDPPAAGVPAGPFPGIVGECAPLRDLLATLARVAPSDLTVHVSGETGTGKDR